MTSPTENGPPLEIEALPELLAQQVETHRADLAGRYQQTLRETLFTSRAQVRPAMVGGIAAEEIESLLNFFRCASTGAERGVQLCQMGLSDQAVLRLGQVTRQFFLTRLERDWLIPAIDLVDAYQNEVIQGFNASREKIILNEQESIRSALQLAVGRYVVEIKEVQAMAQQATEVSEFKTRFMARLSHELRTPLGAVLGMAEMLQQNVYGPLTEAQQDIIRRIINNVQTLEQVFAELLDQSQIELGQLHLKEEEFSPQAMIERVHFNYLPLALQKSLVIHLEIEPDLPDKVNGDEARVEQILSNLTTNAIKFTKIGSVTIHARRENKMYWALQVKDTGIGISEKDQAYIFEAFRQVDETRRRSFGGVGLGLSIVQNLATAMQGKVNVESKIGQGSVFTVVLPIQKAKMEENV